MSSFVCTICHDLLAEPTKIAPGKTLEDYQMVASHCRHMFHRECLMIVFELQTDDNVPLACPVCNNWGNEHVILPLYPQKDDTSLDYKALLNQVNHHHQEVTDADLELQATANDLRIFTEMSYERLEKIPEKEKQLSDLSTQIKNLQLEENRLRRKVKGSEFEKLKRRYEEGKAILEKQTKAAERAKAICADLIQAVNVRVSNITKEEKRSNANKILKNVQDILINHSTMGNESIPELGKFCDLPRIILPKVMFGIPSGSDAKDLAAAYVHVLKSQKNVPARKQVFIYFPRDDIFFPSLEIFQLQIMTFLRIFGIEYKREVVDTDEDELPVMKIGGHVIYNPEFCSEILIDVFNIDTKPQSKNPFKIDGRMINLWKIFSNKIIWALLLWQWAHGNGKSVGIAPEWTPRVAAAVKAKVSERVCQETYGNMTIHTVNKFVIDDVRALSRLLGTENYFNGAHPAEIDCTAFVLLAQILWNSPNSEFRDEVRKHPNLINFVMRMKEMAWPEWEFGSPLPPL